MKKLAFARYSLITGLALAMTGCHNNSANGTTNNPAPKIYSISTSAAHINMIETDITVTNTGSSGIDSINTALTGAFTGLVISPGANNPCQNISMLNPLAPNGTCTIKLINSQKDQAVNSTSGTITITPEGDTEKTDTLNVTAGTYLYAGGKFTTADGNTANYVAKWDGTNWSAIGTGMDNAVNALTVFNNNLYAGGAFTTADGKATNHIAVWDGANWSAVGDGTGTNGTINALSVFNNNLYVGGIFTQAGATSANYIAEWDGSQWSALGNGISSLLRVGMITSVNSLSSNDNTLYVGGTFSSAGGITTQNIAAWDGSNWSALSSGVNRTVNALAVQDNNLYAGGDFSSAGGSSANNLATWNGSAWSAIGSGTDAKIYSISTTSDNNLFVAGSFAQAGGAPANNIAEWNGSTWSALGDGTNANINSVIYQGNTLYIGGAFTQAGANNANKVAIWNGTEWSALGDGMNDDVNCLVLAASLDVSVNQ